MTYLPKLSKLLAIAGIFLLIPMLPAEMQSSGTILLAMGKNAKEMMQYAWKQRITVTRKGNPTEPVIDEVHFDPSGQLQRTTISAPETKRTGGIRGKIAADVKENVKGMMELAGRYNKPQQMMEAIKKAQITRSAQATELQASNLLEPADSMTMRLDPQTHLATHVDIQTHYQGSAMTIAQDYSPLPGGPNVMKTMRVSAPQKGLAVTVDSFDFVRQTASAR